MHTVTSLPAGQRLLTAALGLLLAAIVGLGLELIATLRAHQHLRVDLAEINDVKHGLLNADAWVAQVTAIVDKKIDEFRLTRQNRQEIKRSLEKMLDVLLTEADRYLRRQKRQGFKARLKENVREKLIDIDEVKRGIPQYADRILDTMDQPKNRAQLEGFARSLLSQASSSTFSETDRSRLQAIHARHQCADRAGCAQSIGHQLEQNHRRAVTEAVTLLGLVALLFAGVLLTWRQTNRLRLGLLVICCMLLLACGVLTPMIEVEARISRLSFVLLGEPVEFVDQVFYFQSKSVLDVVRILTSTGKPDMILVGVLLMTFSVIFPCAKFVASFIYLFWQRLRARTLVQFFALKSSKWSMADVFVVAMFMAYVGFSGVISSQLTTFRNEAASAHVNVLTTNGTELQIGFFMFLAFCLAGLVTSTAIDAAIARES